MAAAVQHKLVLAVHTVDQATAKVPFSMILLLDFAKRKATPPGSRCRMVVPSDGTTSVSLWDTVDPEALQEWLAENLGGDCSTELHGVEEDFTFGLSLELARVRAAERVADGSLKAVGALGERTSKAAERVAAGVTTAVGSTQQKLEEWDQRTGVISQAKETTTAIQQRVIGAMAKAAEDRRVQSVVGTVSTGVTSGWAKVAGWVGARMQDAQLGEGGYGHSEGGGGSQAYMQPGDDFSALGSGTAASQYQGGQGHHQHALGGSSGGGGGIPVADSTDSPLAFTDSMLSEPAHAAGKGAHAAGKEAPAASPTAAAAAPAAHSGGGGGQP